MAYFHLVIIVMSSTHFLRYTVTSTVRNSCNTSKLYTCKNVTLADNTNHYLPFSAKAIYCGVGGGGAVHTRALSSTVSKYKTIQKSWEM